MGGGVCSALAQVFVGPTHLGCRFVLFFFWGGGGGLGGFRHSHGSVLGFRVFCGLLVFATGCWGIVGGSSGVMISGNVQGCFGLGGFCNKVQPLIGSDTQSMLWFLCARL